MQPIQADQLIPLSSAARSQLVKKYANSVNLPSNINSDLHSAYKFSTVLTPLISDFIQHQIQTDISHTHGSVLQVRRQSQEISSICRKFASNFMASMKKNLRSPAQMESSPRNLYEMCGAGVFAESNSISRKLSTDMGSLWEKIANISPYAVSPERDFGIKITGIDLIILDKKNKISVFVQIKTQRNTLTGSQAPRSRSELELHQHKLFAAAFCTGDSWTFSSPNIPRVCGAEFWCMIGINYELLKFYVKQMVLKIQSEYIKFQQQPPT